MPFESIADKQAREKREADAKSYADAKTKAAAEPGSAKKEFLTYCSETGFGGGPALYDHINKDAAQFFGVCQSIWPSTFHALSNPSAGVRTTDAPVDEPFAKHHDPLPDTPGTPYQPIGVHPQPGDPHYNPERVPGETQAEYDRRTQQYRK